jgi:hypothetical protein
MLELHLAQAQKYLDLLDEQVGRPSVPTMPQTTHQAIVLILKEMQSALMELAVQVRHLSK